MKKIFILILLFSGCFLYPQEVRFIEVTGTSSIEYPADQVSWRIIINAL